MTANNSNSPFPSGFRPGALVLADGQIFEGHLFGAPSNHDRPFSGEVVFNTALAGYQEVLTDPSYAGQVITFTYPHFGNYGVNEADNESRQIFARGVVVRDLSRIHSNYRSEGSVADFLTQQGVGGIAGVDTRRLTRHIRDRGAMPGAFGSVSVDGDARQADLARLTEAAQREPGTDGVDLVAQVTTERSYQFGTGRRKVVALDLGIKRTILEHLGTYADVTVMPASTPASEILALNPEGVFLSNGPGDPTEVPYAIQSVQDLLGQVPVFGICLGHQVLSLALGGTISKLAFGHHGANHPVRQIATGKVEITSQNHNFAVEAASLEGVATVTHINLNDGVCEGLRVNAAPAFSVQHHPEAAPGPHDSAYLFGEFEQLMERGV